MHPIIKKVNLLFLFVAAGCVQQLHGQQTMADSITAVLKNYRQKPGFEKDTVYITTLNDLAFRLYNNKPDTAILLSNEAIQLSEKLNFCAGKADAQKNIALVYNIQSNYNRALSQLAGALTTALNCNYKKGAGRIYHNTGIVYSNTGNYPLALENYFRALKMREAIGDTLGIASSINGIGAVYFVQGKYEDAKQNYEKALNLAQRINFTGGIESGYANLGEVYFKQGNYTAAEKNLSAALQISRKTGSKETEAFVNYILASIALKQNKFTEAMQAFEQTKTIADAMGSREYEIRSYIGFAEVYIAQKNYTAALDHAKKAALLAKQIGYNELLRDGNELLSRIYEQQGNGLQALYHHKQFKLYADSINNQQTEQRAQNLAADYEFSKREIVLKAEQEKQEIAFEKKNSQQRWIIFTILAALFSSLVVGSLIFRSRQKEKKTNLLLQKKNMEVDQQKTNVETALTNLKAAQQQLIQSEKMASLGELTAGIAHEIQNPLNFVNNFSDVSNELINEMVDEINSGNTEEAKTIAKDVQQNLEKILHHGKRAEGIVKGMLQHSRASSGQKELTDINVLAEEYLRLAYHGLRAKDKSFNARFETNLDPALEKINLMPQEMGRVILNMVTNAFYAVNERKKKEDESYEPVVTVSTAKEPGKLFIRVKDNGSGIPAKAVDKIFQPFFTTKPTGQGTGLGLSMSYEIVTKGHGGELKVQTKEGEGTEFTVVLPI